ncbi:putative TPR repeat [Verrucomicrobia bacterium]|nr:putative TPR repeat [Verrucomicrobiota bacterium]
MYRKRLYVLLGLLVVAVGFALSASRLPHLLDPKLVGNGETNSFADNVLRRAVAGEARAQYLLGLQYARGALGKRQDLAEATNWLVKAADQGLVNAQRELGHLYEFAYYHSGCCDMQCAQAAETWKRKVAEQGDREAEYDLYNFMSGRVGLFLSRYGTNDPDRAFESMEWCRRAAEHGLLGAQNTVAQDHLERGEYSQAAAWLKTASEQGCASSMNDLACLYDAGLGVPKDPLEAGKLLLRAADTLSAEGVDPLSFPELFFRLGEKCASGFGLPRDVVEAYMWYNIAAASGQPRGQFNKAAREKRDELAARITSAQITEAQRRATAYLAGREPHDGQAEEGRSGSRESIAGAKGNGSGFFVTEDGYLLTSYHVVEQAARIMVQTRSGPSRAKFVKSDVADDLALLKVEGKFHALPIVSSGSAQLGEAVFAIGFPNMEIQGVEPKLTRGEISGLCGIQDDPRHFQISVSVQPGNSGSPLVNLRGNVVGMIRLRLDDKKTLELTGALPQNVNYAIKSSCILALVEAVPELSGRLRKPWTAKERGFGDVVKEAQEAAALILVY